MITPNDEEVKVSTPSLDDKINSRYESKPELDLTPEPVPEPIPEQIKTEPLSSPNQSERPDNSMSTWAKNQAKREKKSADRKLMLSELRHWRSLPQDDPNRNELKKQWSLKWHGTETVPKTSGFIYGSGVPGATLSEDLAHWSTQLFQGLGAVGQGLIDFYSSDVPSLIPGVNIPKVPEYENPVFQGARELSSFILPAIQANRLAYRHLASYHKAGKASPVLQNLGNNPLFRKFSTAGLALGTEVAVEYTNALNQNQENISRVIKDNWPALGQYIPDTWATNDTDSPDIKRAKNVNDAVRLFGVSTILESLVKLGKARGSLSRATEYIPKNEKSKKYFKRRVGDDLTEQVLSENPIEDAMEKAAIRQDRALDELAQYTVASAEDLNKPIKGLHNVFDPLELGVRTADPDGIVGATVDAARIKGNLKTSNGRLGSIVTPAALKFGLKGTSLNRRILVKGIVEHIKEAGKYDALIDNKPLSWKQIDDAGTALAEVMTDPRMEPGMLRAILNELKNDVDGLRVINDVAYDGAFKSISRYMDEFLSMDVQKAQAYLSTSLAGQASDIAEGARLMDGTPAIEAAQEMVLDRLEYLMVEKGLASWFRGAGLANINVWKRIKLLNDPKKLKEASDLAHNAHKEALANLIPDTKNVMDSLRAMSKERPEFLRPLMLAYEHTDGNIDSMHKLNNWVRQNLGTLEKAFVDGQPEIPSIINRSMWSNIYNSALSAFATPLRAGLGNLGGIIADPVSLFAGAILEGDKELIQRGLHVYGGVTDTLQKSTQHMGQIFRKAANDPTSVGYIMREDIALKNEEGYEALRAFADAASQRGEDGPAYLLQIYETNEDLARHPWLRFGANSMTSLDGFTRAFKANGDAKARAFDAITSSGREITEETLKEASDKVYAGMFDANGMITDSAVDYASREIALNLDSPLIQGLNNVLARVPALKPWMMFPRTAMNMLGTFHKYSPASMLLGDYQKIAGRSLDSFGAKEIEEILGSKGIPIDENYMMKFRELRAKVKGRVAIGNTFVMTAGAMFASNRLRGNGHHDKTRQRNRIKQGWKPRTYKGWDGKWYSYDGMGPLSDWLSLVADIMDNFDLVTSPMQEEWLSKASFVLGANITSKSVLGQLEPMNDVLGGNPTALARWGSQFANIMMPLGSQRVEWGRVLQPQLKELNQEFFELLRNRNKFLDTFDSFNALPNSHDWIDGNKIGYPENVFTRLWNAYAPTFKMHGGDVSPERQFLIDIEYNAIPSFRTNGQGVVYTPSERAELQSIMGKQGFFKRDVRDIMADAKRDGMIKNFKNLRRRGVTSEQIDIADYKNYIRRLDVSLNRALRQAELELSNYNEIRQRQFELNVKKDDAKRGLLLPTR